MNGDGGGGGGRGGRRRGAGGGGRGRGGGDGGDPEVEDEFACAGMLRAALGALHRTVERIFGVRFIIGADGDHPTNGEDGQMWLKLQGHGDNVKAAKLFVKGLVNQEEQMEVSYPRVLHCVFCGARGLFMDCLIRSTSAHIVVGSPGSLLISGLAEPVVRAYSLITDLVDRYEDTQPRQADAGERVPGESLDSRRTFKTLVEKWDDLHTLDLLVLPGSVKEILLDLVKDSGFGSGHSPLLTVGNEGQRSGGGWKEIYAQYVTPGSAAEDSSDQSEGAKGGADVAEERPVRSPQEVGEEEQPEPTAAAAPEVKEEQEQQLSVGNKEFWLLLKFFTAMGYTEEVVKRVLARTGPKEASQILDLVQQEQDLSDREQTNQQRQKREEGVSMTQIEKNRPCETEHREDEEMSAEGDEEVCDEATGGGEEEEGGVGDKEEAPEEDFVLGVLKKAAASCGYTEQNVTKLYNMLPDHSTHRLLLELQREVNKDREALREEPREMDDVVVEKVQPAVKEARGETELFTSAQKQEAVDDGWVEVTNRRRVEKPVRPPANQHKLPNPHQVLLPQVKGPPVPTYPSPLNPPFQSNRQHNQPILWSSPEDELLVPSPRSNSLKRALQAPQPPVFTGSDASPTRSRDKGRGLVTGAPGVVVTGEQRFLEGLQAPFNLRLTDQPGDPKLRTIIIDGSNVAMSHGLGHFFSCRGIALAVQHFWDRGHRHISVFLPQWRQKSDPQNKEQHYLTELQRVGLLSYTPSREVMGKRISSYDDRFMLQLAQKTDGVIVTNDNLRDLSDESPVWRDIIKKRLLQYTFVGDHFMVPDDPLGRGGPHLDIFLRSDHRTPDAGNHSFAGLANAFTSSKPQRSQTEVLNFRDRTLGGSADVTRGAGRTRGRGGGGGGGRGAGGLWNRAPRAADRSPEETAGLREQLCQVFVGQDNMVALVLQCHPAETDINVLSDLILEQEKE